jgi:hypothetical protein
LRLPNAERATVDDAKVRDYLLSPDHRVGRSKARFFGALGFSHAAWPALRDALLALAREGAAEPGVTSVFGQKYVVRGMLRGPTGRAAAVVTAWIVLRGEDVPRFVTAYPAEGPR